MAVRHILALALVLASPAVLVADADTPPGATSCAAEPNLPPEWNNWRAAVPLKTMSTYSQAEAGLHFPLPKIRADLVLYASSTVAYRAAPGAAISATTYGGMIEVRAQKEGRLKIALDDSAWIDLVRDGVAVPSVAHSHGPPCSGIRKIVEFDVERGIYTLQIVNAPKASIGAMALMAD